jgi:hypothetical protein
MTLVSLGNNIVFFLNLLREEGHLYIYIMNNTVPRIDPWGTLCFSVSQSEKKL